MQRKAFTIIELAMVLIIVGLLIGGGASLFSVTMERQRVTQTKQDMEANIESVIGYAATYGYLPNQDNFDKTARAKKDKWQRKFYYIPAPNLVDLDYDICYVNESDLNITDKDDNVKVEDVAFVIISSGPNYNMQTAMEDNEVKIHDQNETNIDDNSTDAGGYEKMDYDDIAKWVTFNELRSKIGCSGDRLKILNESLPNGKEGVAYDATIYVEGGVGYDSGGKYKWEVTNDCNLETEYDISGSTEDDSPSISSNRGARYKFHSDEVKKDGTCKITVTVKDRLENNTTKEFVLTIHVKDSSSSSSGGGGSSGGSGVPFMS